MTAGNLIRPLRPSPERLAAVAAVHDPSLLLQLEAGQSRRAPLRHRVRAALAGESGGPLLLVAGVALALLWSNSPWGSSYSAFWHARIGLTVGPWTLGADLRTWIDEGLMTLFFLVVGLEAKRERDLGELRDGRRLTAREHDGQLVPARSGRRHVPHAAGAVRPVPHRATAAGCGRAPADPQLLPVGSARRARLPDQRQAGGRRQPLHA